MNTYVQLNAEALLHNYDMIRGMGEPLHNFPVIKSNAYGHGIKEVANILNARLPPYLVAQSLDEAKQAREVTAASILVLGTSSAAEIGACNLPNIVHSVNDTDTLNDLISRQTTATIHICLNTGMNREGIDVRCIRKVASLLHSQRGIKAEGLWSHFATACSDDTTYMREQARRFHDAVVAFSSLGCRFRWRHIANSAGFLRVKDGYLNAYRSGMAGYGQDPTGDFPGLRQTLKLVSYICDVRQLQPGQAVGYDCTYVATESERIGLVPLGYYDGIPRSLSNCGYMTFACSASNARLSLPIRGRVSMNHTCIGLGATGLQKGSQVIAISDNPSDMNTVQAIAHAVNTIPDEILTGICSTLPRLVY